MKSSREIVFYPQVSEKNVGMIERENKLVFIVDSASSKKQIKGAIEDLYKVKVDSVNTLIQLKGRKKAIVKLAKENSAADLAANLKML